MSVRSFDLDAEAARFDSDAASSHELVQMSYGVTVGVPKILQLLERLEIGATFFVPGRVVDTYTDMCESLLEEGHEIGHRS